MISAAVAGSNSRHDGGRLKTLVLGAGGIGGYYGGRLGQAGADVTFLVRPHRKAQLERDGLRVESSLGNIEEPVATLTAETVAPGYDLILFTCKAYDLESAMDAVAPAVDARTAILPMLNGMAHLDRLDARFGAGRVLGGTCMIDVTLRPDGLVQHIGSLQRIVFGERDRQPSARIGAIAEAFGRTSVDWELADDIAQRMWDKVAFLSALAATTCLFRANVSEIMASPGGAMAMERALATNFAVAARAGHPLSEAAREFARTRLTDTGGPWSASILRDLESGGRVEADHIVGWMLDRARAHQLDDTILALAFTHLKAYEHRRDAGRLPA
jgi:2-dehydropantoate 2-reductase